MLLLRPVLYIHPIKQGLKLKESLDISKHPEFVLYIHPIKQGLKLKMGL